jgi:hypothetical protein
MRKSEVEERDREMGEQVIDRHRNIERYVEENKGSEEGVLCVFLSYE